MSISILPRTGAGIRLSWPPRANPALLLLAPSLLLLAAFTYWPVASVTAQSFRITAFGGGGSWGFGNYARLFSDPHFFQTVRINLVYALGTVVPSLVMALLFALGLRRNSWLTALLRTAIVAPMMIPLVAAAALGSFVFLPGTGLLDHLLAHLGLGPRDWLGNPSTALPCIIAISVWKDTGTYMLFFLAGLSAVPDELLDAAALDGAGPLRRFWHVILPLLTPTIAFLAPIALLNALIQVDQVVLLTQGGPSGATTLLFYISTSRRRRTTIPASPPPRRSRVSWPFSSSPGWCCACWSGGPITRPDRKRQPGWRLLAMAALCIAALAWAVPFLWMAEASLRPGFPPDIGALLPHGPFGVGNYATAWTSGNFPLWYLNTLVMCGGMLTVQIVTATAAGYAFARLRFPGENTVFGLFMLQILLVPTLLIVPDMQTIATLGLYDTLPGIMAPYFATAFGTFLMRQCFRSIPIEYEEAARLDGAGLWTIMRRILLPMSRPFLLAFAIVSVSTHWNEFLWPLIATASPSRQVLTVGLASFATGSEAGGQWGVIAAGTLLVAGPLLLLFLIFQRRFVNAFVLAGLK